MASDHRWEVEMTKATMALAAKDTEIARLMARIAEVEASNDEAEKLLDERGTIITGLLIDKTLLEAALAEAEQARDKYKGRWRIAQDDRNAYERDLATARATASRYRAALEQAKANLDVNPTTLLTVAAASSIVNRALTTDAAPTKP